MLKKFCFACLVLPLILNADTTTYISEPSSVAVVKKNITDLKEEINSQNDVNVQEIYDHLITKKKEVTNKNLLEIYYVILSFLRVQSNALPKEQMRKKLASLLDSVNWLYSDHTGEKFTDSVTNLGRLLNSEIFIHLNVQKMSECLDIAHNLKNIVEYSNLGNDLSPEDGPDYFSPDFFLNKEIGIAQQIYNQVIELESQSQNFSKNCATLSKQQLTDNLEKANDFINGLQVTTINVGSKKVKISRNIRKHLKNLASSSIEKLVEQKNKIDYQ